MDEDYTQLLKIICTAAICAFGLNLLLTLLFKDGVLEELTYAMAHP